VAWETKIELAMHTGNVGSPYRKRLAKAAEVRAQTKIVVATDELCLHLPHDGANEL